MLLHFVQLTRDLCDILVTNKRDLNQCRVGGLSAEWVLINMRSSRQRVNMEVEPACCSLRYSSWSMTMSTPWVTQAKSLPTAIQDQHSLELVVNHPRTRRSMYSRSSTQTWEQGIARSFDFYTSLSRLSWIEFTRISTVSIALFWALQAVFVLWNNRDAVRHRQDPVSRSR